MPDTPTPIYGFVVPTVSGDANAWGGELNGDLASLDTVIGLPRIKRAVVAAGVMDLSVSNFFELTVSAPIVLSFAGTPTGTFASQVILKVINGGSANITWPNSITWLGTAAAPALKTTGTDFLTFWTNDNGLTWFGAKYSTTASSVLFIDVNKSTSSSTDVSISSFTVPAGLLSVNGQKLRIRVEAVISGGTNPTGTLNPKFGGTALGSVTFTSGAVLDISITRLSNTSEIAYRIATVGGSSSVSGSIVRVNPTETLSNTVLFDVRGSETGGATLTVDSVVIEFLTA